MHVIFKYKEYSMKPIKLVLPLSILTLMSAITGSNVALADTSTTHECTQAPVSADFTSCTPQHAPLVKHHQEAKKAVSPKTAPTQVVVQNQKSEQPIIIERRDQSPIIIHNNNNNENNNIIDSYDGDEVDSARHARLHKKKAHSNSKPKKKVNSDISLYAHGGFFTRISKLSIGGEARVRHFGFGLFYDHISARDLSMSQGILSGDRGGLDLHYHFTSFNDVHNNGAIDPGLYAEGALGRYHMFYTDRFFSGLMLGAGFDVAYPLTRNVNLYGKAGINYIKYESDFFYAGESLTAGVRYDF